MDCTGRPDSAGTGSSCPPSWAGWWPSSCCMARAETTRSGTSGSSRFAEGDPLGAEHPYAGMKHQ